MKELIAYILIGVLTAGIGYTGYQLYKKGDWIPQGEVDEMIDEHTRALSAQRVAYVTLQDSLRSMSDKIEDVMKERDEQILAYQEITGRLRIERDSLRLNQMRIPDSWVYESGEEEEGIQPTRETLIFTEEFSQGLFRVTSELSFKSSYIQNDIAMEQLRDIRIRQGVTVQPDGNLTFYTNLPDFDTHEQYVYQPQQREVRESPWWLPSMREAGLIGLIALLLLR